MRQDDSRPPSVSCGAEFHSTHWSLVVRAAAGDGTGEEALAALCDRYWYPLYAYVRRRAADVHEAQDLTQAFFARMLEKRSLDRASPERGRFRAFLLTSFKNFLAGEWERERAVKRGGRIGRLSIDFGAGESRLSLEPSHEATAERLYERRWALTLLEVVTARLQAEFEAAGKGRHWELLKDTLAGGRDGLSYECVGRELGLGDDAVRQAAHRLRKRYREILREEVAHTVSGPDEIDDEIRALFDALSP